jgi:predicted AlkP superfamily phosphohydrolase/phosphomutase
MNERVVMIGLDGAEPAVIDRLLPRCPNLARLAGEGAWGTLTSTLPPLSPPAWATLMTGVNPGKHGVYDFYQMTQRAQRSYVRRLITSAAWRAPGLWDFATQAGRRAGFVNMPMCWPPPAVDGFFVCGLGAPAGNDGWTHPRSLATSLADAILEPGDGTTMGDPAAFLDRCARSGASMLEVAERLWRSEPLDLFCAALTFPDRFQHLFWTRLVNGDAAVVGVWDAWFAAFDAFLGRVMDAAAQAGSTVILFSDHGFGPVERYFHVNRWLYQRGYLAIGDPTRLGTPDGLLTAIDWASTHAYGLGEYGEIRLNLRGREPLGCVAPGSQARALEIALMTELHRLRDRDEPVVDEVREGAGVYHGPHADEGADLLVQMRDRRVLCLIDGRGNDLRDPNGPLFEDAAGPQHYRGAHRDTGLLAAWGAGIRPNAPRPAAMAQDVCPTVLHCLGLPLDRDLDGRILRELLSDELAARQPQYTGGVSAATADARAAYDAAEEAAIADQLRQLGYLE